MTALLLLHRTARLCLFSNLGQMKGTSWGLTATWIPSTRVSTKNGMCPHYAQIPNVIEYGDRIFKEGIRLNEAVGCGPIR